MTIGKAIEEQRKFKADASLEEAKQQALKAKFQSEREAAQKQMRDAVTVSLVSKKIRAERGYSGIIIDENLEVTFGYKNNTDKDVAGVKGHASIKDLFGDEISGFQIANDSTIKAGQSVTWTGSRSVRLSLGHNNDRKLAELEDDKYMVVWEPQMIIFKDGTKLTDSITPDAPLPPIPSTSLPSEISPRIEIEPFTVQLGGSDNFLQTTMVWTLASSADKAVLQSFNPEIRHKILLLLSSKSLSQVSGAAAQAKLAEEIRSIANSIVGSKGATVKGVSFVTFVTL